MLLEDPPRDIQITIPIYLQQLILREAHRRKNLPDKQRDIGEFLRALLEEKLGIRDNLGPLVPNSGVCASCEQRHPSAPGR